MNIRQIEQIAKYFAKNAKIADNAAYNQVGNRLATKLTVAGNSLKNMHIPQGTVSVEFLKVEKEFGKSSSNIISFKDINENLIERIRIDKTPGQTRHIQSQYHFDKTGLSSDGCCIDFTDIKRTTTLNGKLQSSQRDMISYAFKKESAPIVTHSRLETIEHPYQNARNEIQTIKSWTKGDKQNAKYLQITGCRENDGKIQLMEISGNTNQPIETFKNDPYIMTRMYSNNDFIHSIKYHIAEMSNLPVNKLKLKTKNKLKNCNGYFRPATGEVVIAANVPKIDLVGNIAHELRHQKQFVTAKKAVSNFIRRLSGGDKVNTRENQLGLKYLKDEFLHLFCLNGRIKNLYYKNGLEKDAFKTGNRFKKVYGRLNENLYNEFPHASSKQFGYSDKCTGIKRSSKTDGGIEEIDLFSTKTQGV